MGRNYTLGDVVPFEWGAGKSIDLGSDIFKQVIFGAVGYAQWQVTNNQINLTPTTKIGQAAIDTLEHTSARIYSAGPAVNLLTKYGLLFIALLRRVRRSCHSVGQTIDVQRDPLRIVEIVTANLRKLGLPVLVGAFDSLAL
jgi:hypothetical protein